MSFRGRVGLGTGTLSVNLTGGTAASYRRLVVSADGSGNANLTLGSGTVEVTDPFTMIAGTIVTSGTGTLTLRGPGDLGNVTIGTAATVNLANNPQVENLTISAGTLNLAGQTLTVRGNFTRTGGALGTTGSLAFQGGTAAATFAAGPNFVGHQPDDRRRC